ncbi:MAG: hypothetical protein R2688_00155 [Fimbriimonadaceae bacterium]
MCVTRLMVEGLEGGSGSATVDGLALPAPTAKIARMLHGELGLLV